MNADGSSYRYVFTLFQEFTPEYQEKHKVSPIDHLTSEQLERFLHETSKVWSFQLEKTQKQRLHYQGRFSLFKRKTKKQLLKLFLDFYGGLSPNNDTLACKHFMTLLTVDKEQDTEASFKYTKKSESRVDGTFRCYPPIYTGNDLEIMSQTDPKYAWQTQLDSILKSDFSDRKVIVIYDPVGGRGKTKWIKRHLFLNEYSQFISVENNVSQILAALAAGNPKQTYLLDIPRAKRPRESWYELFRLCENLKNGLISSTFYGRYNMTMFNSANVILMTNYDILSDVEFMDQLSADRWEIYTIRDFAGKTYLSLETNDGIIDIRPDGIF